MSLLYRGAGTTQAATDELVNMRVSKGACSVYLMHGRFQFGLYFNLDCTAEVRAMNLPMVA